MRIKSKSVQELDKLRNVIEFQKFSFILLQKAADLWAELRATGQPNKVKENIDIDCILSAQWSLLKEKYPSRRVIIASKNIKDFQNITDCSLWEDIHY